MREQIIGDWIHCRSCEKRIFVAPHITSGLCGNCAGDEFDAAAKRLSIPKELVEGDGQFNYSSARQDRIAFLGKPN